MNNSVEVAKRKKLGGTSRDLLEQNKNEFRESKVNDDLRIQKETPSMMNKMRERKLMNVKIKMRL